MWRTAAPRPAKACSVESDECGGGTDWRRPGGPVVEAAGGPVGVTEGSKGVAAKERVAYDGGRSAEPGTGFGATASPEGLPPKVF